MKLYRYIVYFAFGPCVHEEAGSEADAITLARAEKIRAGMCQTVVQVVRLKDYSMYL